MTIEDTDQASLNGPLLKEDLPATAAAASSATPKQAGTLQLHTEDQVESALDRCDNMLAWYEKHVSSARVWYRLFNTATIVLAAATPVLILWAPPAISPIWQAAPAAFASLLATIVGSYRWREDWIRYAVAAETLRSERSKFVTRATQDYSLRLSADEAFDNFVYRIESLAISEVSEWRNQLAQKTTEPNKDSHP